MYILDINNVLLSRPKVRHR